MLSSIFIFSTFINSIATQCCGSGMFIPDPRSEFFYPGSVQTLPKLYSFLSQKRPGPINYSGSGQKVPDTIGSEPTTTLLRTYHFCYYNSTPFHTRFLLLFPHTLCSLRPQTSRKLNLLFLIYIPKQLILPTYIKNAGPPYC